MTQINTSTNTTAAASQPAGATSALGDLDLDVFLDLMLQELQNQDPLDPMDNDQLLRQLSTIREISASDKLGETLESVLLGQNVATATGLIGTEVEALTDAGARVVGAVQRVTINEGSPLLELAIEPAAQASSTEGALESGNYSYEVVWESDDALFSVRVTTDTESLEDFNGAIRLDNLPQTNVPKRVFRTDRSGQGDLQLIGTLPAGQAGTAFTDQREDSERLDEKIPENRQILRFGDKAEVRLSNVASVETLR